MLFENLQLLQPSHDHAIQREVNALLAERADEVIFEFVERDRFSAYGERPKVEQSEFR